MDLQALTNEYFAYFREWDAAYADYARACGLSLTGLCLLGHLYDTKSCTQKMLCERCGLPKQTVNAIVTALYKKGWVGLTEIPSDRRNKAVFFTEIGKQEAENILLPLRSCEQRAMRNLSEDEQKMLLSVTKQYIASCSEELKRAQKRLEDNHE